MHVSSVINTVALLNHSVAMSSAYTNLTVLFVLLASLCCNCDDRVVVSVTGGTIVGTVELSAQGRPYNAFRAVPYAGFVEGVHRFQVSKR